MFRTKNRRIGLVLLLLWAFLVFSEEAGNLGTVLQGEAILRILGGGFSPVLIFIAILWIKETPKKKDED